MSEAASHPPDEPSVQSACEQVHNQTLRPGITCQEGVKAWSDMGPKYNELVAALKYKAPRIMAEVTSELFHDKSGVKVLEVACGTGLGGEHLRELGFTHIDGVDPAEGMLTEARSKGIYATLLQAYVGVGDSKLPIEDNFYDAVSVCGAMGHGMMPCAGLYEMARLTKPGGYVVNVFREEILSEEEYKDRLLPLMAGLETAGVWREVRRGRFPDYRADRVGLVRVHQVC